MNAKNLKTAQTAGIAVGGLAAIALIGVILYALWDGIKSLFDGINEALDGVGNIVEEAAETTEEVATVGIGLVGGGGSPNQDFNDDPDSYSPTSSDLKLVVIRKSDKNTGLTKYTEVKFRVVDGTGQGVPFATVTGTSKYGPTAAILGNIVKVTDRNGYTGTIYWKVQDIAFTDREDDFNFRATKKGFNPSNVVTVR